MPRTCTVCTHQERREIDKALVAATMPYRTIADRYGLTHQSLLRHKADHLLPEIVAAWQAERHVNGLELATELRGWMDTIGKLLRACDEWLTDPHDPTRYDLSPRAHEVWCHYEVAVCGGRPLRKKERLSALLARVATASVWPPYELGLIEQKSADPRKLLLDTSKTLESHLRLIAEIAGKVQTQGTTTFLLSPEWLALRGRMLVALAPYPEARIALATALGAGDARAA